MKRLSNKKRAELEMRLKALRTASAVLDPNGKLFKAVDAVGEEQSDIEGLVEKIMKLMDASPDVAKYHTASKHEKLAYFFRKAFEHVQGEHDESAEEEAEDLQDPALHIFEDAEHEAQSLDDPSLVEEVQHLEEHVKQILNKHDESRKPEMHHEEVAPAAEHKEEEHVNPLEKLKALPKEARMEKAAKLRRLAEMLDGEDKDEDKEEEHKEDEKKEDKAEDMDKDMDKDKGEVFKEMKAAQKLLRTLIAACDDVEEEMSKDGEDKEDAAKKAMLNIQKLAYKSLQASIEDMEDELAKKDDKEKEDKDCGGMEKEAARDLDESEGGKPNWLQEKQEEAEAKEDDKGEDKKDEDALSERTAFLRSAINKAHLQRQASEKLKSDEEADKKIDAITQEQVLSAGECAAMGDTPEKNIERGDVVPEGEDFEKVKKELDCGPVVKEEFAPSELSAEAKFEAMFQARFDRATKLATKMFEVGLLRTEAQWNAEIKKIAVMDDATYNVLMNFVADKPAIKRTASPSVKDEHKEDEHEEQDHDEDDDAMIAKANAVNRKASKNSGGSSVFRKSANVQDESYAGADYIDQPIVMAHQQTYPSGKEDFQTRIAQMMSGKLTTVESIKNSTDPMLDLKRK